MNTQKHIIEAADTQYTDPRRTLLHRQIHRPYGLPWAPRGSWGQLGGPPARSAVGRDQTEYSGGPEGARGVEGTWVGLHLAKGM
jgi:hypothetical protein